MFTPSTRESAINAVNALLENLPLHINKGNLEDAIRMVDRAIGGILGHPDSPVMNTFRSNQQILFPGGLEKTCGGRDIILVLNSKAVEIKNPAGKMISYPLPTALRNPEKGIAQIVGLKLAEKLFAVRTEILTKLSEKNAEWKINVEANKKAQDVLSKYPYQLAQQYMKEMLKTAEQEFKKNRFLSSLKFLDNGIRALLAQPQSKMSFAIKKHAKFFSSNLSSKGSDFISILKIHHVHHTKILMREFKSTKNVMNLEDEMTHILGKPLTKEIFHTRQQILIGLTKEDKAWQSSLTTNEKIKNKCT